MIRRMKTIASLQELISAKIRSSNSAGKIMAELKEADLLNRLLAFRGLVFSKREDSKVRQFLADFLRVKSFPSPMDRLRRRGRRPTGKPLPDQSCASRSESG